MNFGGLVIAVLAVMGCGVLLARCMAVRPRGQYWPYGLALAVLALLLAGRFDRIAVTVPALHRLAASQWRYPLLALAITLGLETCRPRLRFVWQQRLTTTLMAGFVAWFCLAPCLGALWARHALPSLPSRFDDQGICRQTRPYTCGPAAAVTALRTLGLPADEGTLAGLAGSTPLSGTLPQTLARTLQDRYADDGLECRYEPVASADQLRHDDAALVILREGFLADHCVAVLNVTDQVVVIADPADGKRTLPRSQFERLWRHWAIRLRRAAL